MPLSVDWPNVASAPVIEPKWPMRIASPEGTGEPPAGWPPPDFSPPPQPNRPAARRTIAEANTREVRGGGGFMGPRFRGGIIGLSPPPRQPDGLDRGRA